LALSRILLAGEAISHLTPTAQLGGEAVKVYLLRAYDVGSAAGLASVVAARVALTIAQVAFILLGLPFFLSRLGWGYHTLVVLGLFLLSAYEFVRLLLRWQRRGLMGMAVRALRQWLPRWQQPARWEADARRVDAHLAHLYDAHLRAFLASTGYHFLGWLVGVVELLTFFFLIGVPVTLLDVLIIEAMVQPLTAVAVVIPGALGVREAGVIFLCQVLGLDSGAGLTVMLLKRAREASYHLIGLVILIGAGYAFLLKTPGDLKREDLKERLHQSEAARG
jgi:uncharacterized protein (TIRG00374 family)